MTDNEKVLIHIPKGCNYIEILGHRIDGFDSFTAFCEHLNKYTEMEETINRQKADIERLEENYDFAIKVAKGEAIRDFGKKLKEEGFAPYFVDNLVKEFTEGEQRESKC